MKLSVVIVNYNVKHFLEQCLFSVMKSICGMNAEVFVVDNNSVDGSCRMVIEKFPQVKLIENKKNTGFSYANNQAIKQSMGEYVLLLNPDTVIEEDTLTKVVSFMDSHPDGGGLGIKMIDGKGHFLPESKRGLPTPAVAFYKIFGLSKLFPKSKRFGKYHLGNLDKNLNHEVDVLSGAFMLLRKSVLEKTGLLDETFFMYGEDIDLSYRITKAGYKNYYFADSTIIHYKGESTKKGSVNYVMVFYKAMIIFATKHFSKQNAQLFSFLINLAIYFRASLAIFSRFVKTAFVPTIDAVLIFMGYLLFKPIWETYKFGTEGFYPPEYLKFVVPAYIAIWIISVFFSGGYDKPVRIVKILRGILFGTLAILVLYSLLSEEYRFSRALILIGTVWSAVVISIFRVLLHLVKINGYRISKASRKKALVVSFSEEAERIVSILKQTEENPVVCGVVCPSDSNGGHSKYIGSIKQIDEIIRVNNIDEIIFGAKDVSAQLIIKNMLDLAGVVEYKIASPDSFSVIGSNSINSSGELYTINLNIITKVNNKRNKRMLDVTFSIMLLLLLPFFLLIAEKKKGLIRNIFYVLLGNLSWIGYCRPDEKEYSELPKIKPGVVTAAGSNNEKINKEIALKINMNYAKDYRLIHDISIFIKNLRFLGN